MKMLRKLFKSLSAKIMAAQLIIVFVMSLVFYQLNVGTLSHTLREGANDVQTVRLQLVSERLDDDIEQCESVARLLMAEDTLQDTLIWDNSMTPTGTGMMRTASNQKLISLLRSYRLQYSMISSVYIYNRHGDVCMLFSSSGRPASGIPGFNDIAQTDWYQTAEERRGYEFFYTGDVLGLEDNVFSCVKVLNSTRDFEHIGLLIMNLRSSILDNALRTESGYERVVMRSGIPESTELRLSPGKTDEDGDSIVSSMVNRRTGWSIEYTTSAEIITDQVNEFRARIYKWLFLFILLLGAMFVIIVTYATIPLKKLRNAIVEAREGEYQPDDGQIRDDEVSEIRGEFRRLMDERVLQRERIDQLEIQQMDAQLHLLQEQINPHFLYNTLDSIYWKAERNGQEDIARMIEALSNTFKIRLSKGMDEIPVKDELHFIEEYMYIQRERFGERLELDMQVSPAVMSCTILKLILQPFIENAVYHGLEPKVDGGKIQLRGYVEDETLIFEITDNGIGMEDQSRFFNGFGIKNVIERIRLRYGDAYGVSIDSEVGKGTMATIRLPKGA